MKNKLLLLIIISFYQNVLWSQSDSNFVSDFFKRQSFTILYWKAGESDYTDEHDINFQSIKIINGLKVSYKTIESNLKIYTFGNYDEPPDPIGTYFYYIPNEEIFDKSLQLFRPDESEIYYSINLDGHSTSNLNSNIIHNHIKQFEKKVKNYNEFRFSEWRFRNSAIPTLVLGLGSTAGAYFFYTSDGKTIEKVVYFGLGTLCTYVAYSCFKEISKGLFNYLFFESRDKKFQDELYSY